MPDDRRVSLDDLGAWLLKGNADHTDLAGRFARDPLVTRWCVTRSYRVELMRAGQPVLLWASGSRRRAVPYGIWGRGTLTGPARQDEGGGWSVPMRLVVAAEAGRLPREILRSDPELAGLEVLRQPQAANPSFVTAGQLAAIERLLGGRGSADAQRQGQAVAPLDRLDAGQALVTRAGEEIAQR